MSERMALRTAIDLLLVPSQVRVVRSAPLPDGLPILLRIAAGDADAERMASALTDRPREVVRRAATFFIEQILFAPDADSYRMLGTNSQATAAELRSNVALLLRWLHPDHDPHDEHSIFVNRVTAAWNNLKTPERRTAYDNTRRVAADRKGRVKAERRWQRNKITAALRRRDGQGIDALVMGDAGKVGFLRRALAMLLNRTAP
jgi:hypothetical protein